MRISNRYITNHMSKNIQNNLSQLARSQEQISTQSRLLRPSDNPNVMGEFLKIKATLSYNEQYKVNIDDGLGYLEMADVSMGTLGDILSQAKELALQAANDSYNAGDRAAIAEQIDSFIDVVVDLGNSTVGGKYIYAGKENRNPPFKREDNIITYHGGIGNEQEITREVTAGTDYVIAEPGVNKDSEPKGLFGNCDETDREVCNGDNPTADNDVFNLLFKLKNVLENGDDPNFGEDIQQSIADLQIVEDQVLQKRTAVGARYRHFESLKTQLMDQEVILTQNLSNIEDADMAKLSIEVAQQQLSYNASLAIGAQVMQTSLLNFIK